MIIANKTNYFYIGIILYSLSSNNNFIFSRHQNRKKKSAPTEIISKNNLFPSFYDAMSNGNFYQQNYPKANPNWQLITSLYQKHILDVQSSRVNKQRIPKIIHQIWLGSPFPKKYEKLRQTWIDFHPGWEYKLWSDQDIEKLGLENKKLYDAAINFGEKSDIARYEILYRFGGLYVDTDFECVKPFDIFHNYCDFYAGLGIEASVILLNGLIGSMPRHPILRQCIDAIRNTNIFGHGFTHTLDRTGPVFLTKVFLATAGKYGTNDVAFPINFFYPFPDPQRHKNTPGQIHKWIRSETYAIHYWDVSWNDGKEG